MSKVQPGDLLALGWNGIFRVTYIGSRHSPDSVSIRKAVTRLGLRSRYGSVCSQSTQGEEELGRSLQHAWTEAAHPDSAEDTPESRHSSLWTERRLAGLRHGRTNVPT